MPKVWSGNDGDDDVNYDGYINVSHDGDDDISDYWDNDNIMMI